jgi:hypothetical protein
MSLQFYPEFFKTPADVLDDVKANETWPVRWGAGALAFR